MQTPIDAPDAQGEPDVRADPIPTPTLGKLAAAANRGTRTPTDP